MPFKAVFKSGWVGRVLKIHCRPGYHPYCSNTIVQMWLRGTRSTGARYWPETLECAKWPATSMSRHLSRDTETSCRDERAGARCAAWSRYAASVQIFLRDWLTRRYKSKSLPEQFPTSLYLCCWGAESLSTTHIHAHFRAQCLFITSYKSKKCHHHGLGRCYHPRSSQLEAKNQQSSKYAHFLLLRSNLSATQVLP